MNNRKRTILMRNNATTTTTTKQKEQEQQQKMVMVMVNNEYQDKSHEIHYAEVRDDDEGKEDFNERKKRRDPLASKTGLRRRRGH